MAEPTEPTQSRSATPLPTLQSLSAASGVLGQAGLPLELSRSLPKAQLSAAQHWSTREWAKVVLNTTRPVPYIYGQLPTPSTQQVRFYLDLLDAQSTTQPEALLQEPDSLLRQIQLTTVNPRISRLWLEVPPDTNFKNFAYELSSQNVIVLEFSKPVPPRATTTATLEEPALPNARDTAAARPRIILDPGHGGYDPGTVSRAFQEKDIVLLIAQKIKDLFQQEQDYEVFLTREGDYFVSTEKRAALAKQYRGDLFVSLHINANENPSVQGIETYFLDTTANQSTLQLASRENAMHGLGLQNFNSILKDLLVVQHASRSTQLAHAIHTRLMRTIGSQYHQIPRDLGVKEAPFVVLLQAAMPAVLVELAFITNPEDKKRLQAPQYQQAVALGIFNGIRGYLLNQRQG